MLPDRVSNPGPLTYESGALPIVVVLGLIALGDSISVYILGHLPRGKKKRDKIDREKMSKPLPPAPTASPICLELPFYYPT